MTFYEERIRHLLRLFADNNATGQDISEMLSLLRDKKGDRELESFMMELRQEPESYTALPSVAWESTWDAIQKHAITPAAPIKNLAWLRVAAAVIILISAGAVGAGIYFFKGPAKEQIVKIKPVRELKKDIPPGSNKAILTLANGSQIILDSASNGVLAQQGNTKVIKLRNGQVVYKKAGEPSQVMYNTIGTPRGGQYRLVLPDGSAVWLNAVSSIRFPTAFTGGERTVEISGEAYFEIAKDPSHPFRVLVNSGLGNKRQEVAVLGTHFDINAYTDEATIKTTVLEGSVMVSHGSSLAIIKPGEQTQLDNGVLQIVHDVNVAEAVAWKEGRFEFKDTDFKTIMRQLMRWYDVEVEYNGNISERYFTADISRNKSLSGVLKILQLSNIDFKLEGKKLTVTP